MATEPLSTFQNLSESGFKSHAAGVITNSSSASRRKASLTYLQMVLSSDSVALDAERKTNNSKRLQNRLKQQEIERLMSKHSFDFSRQAELFTADVMSDSEFHRTRG